MPKSKTRKQSAKKRSQGKKVPPAVQTNPTAQGDHGLSVEDPDGQDSHGFGDDDPDGQGSHGFSADDPDGQGSHGFSAEDPDGQGSHGFSADDPDGQGSHGFGGDDPDGQGSHGFLAASTGQGSHGFLAASTGQGSHGFLTEPDGQSSHSFLTASTRQGRHGFGASSAGQEDKRVLVVNPPPPWRLLRAFAHDPGLATQLENYDVSEVIVRVRWEHELQAGPVGEYFEVVDVDPASGCAYTPVDLNDRHLLAQDGLEPSEGNPQFHQQMVYAVAMATIQHFERALGRQIFWSHLVVKGKGGKPEYLPVRRLRIYPHALREQNAYYDPEKKALLFGYFPAQPERVGTEMPGGMVFTCLSHDIVAHETTHAILDGMQPYFLEPCNVDALAFHEALADLVALLQHFTYPEILRRQLQRARGDLTGDTLLGQLAVQFGNSTGGRGGLRSAIGYYDENDQWQRRKPSPELVATETEPHDRGALLVAAVFDAFLAIYRHRTADLIRIATGGTGVLPEGDVHPDLVNRLAREAAKSAEHVLLMCIRALDYCPPVDVNFGDYLRALITADFDLVPDDDRNYRVAFIESFRKWGIYPPDVRTLSVESLRWKPSDQESVKPFLQSLHKMLEEDASRELWQELCTGVTSEEGQLTKRRLNRDELWARMDKLSAGLHARIKAKANKLYREKLMEAGTSFLGLNVGLGHEDDAKFSVHKVRPVRRLGPDGRTSDDLLIQLVQRRPAYLDEARQAAEEKRYRTKGAQAKPPDFRNCDFRFRGGVTLIIDLETFRVKYAIEKNILGEGRLKRQRDFMLSTAGTLLSALYFGKATDAERLAHLHSCAH